METTNDVMYKNPYQAPKEVPQRSVIVRAGMSVVEMVIWLAVMAVLSLGMIWLLWSASR